MKDALGHGSEPRGGGDQSAHAQGTQQTGRRYHVMLKPYSLAANNVGQSLNRDMTISTHNSLAAAGDKLGSLIRGKLKGTADSIVKVAGVVSGGPAAAQYHIEDRMTGDRYTRNGARTRTPLASDPTFERSPLTGEHGRRN